jgi:hypothetical protein
MMIDRIALSPWETVLLDTTNNTVTIVLLANGNISIRDDKDRVYAYLQGQYEMYTLAIGTGIYSAVNEGSGTVNILIVREFIY